jgi:soluble lytic murein transglycosylase-like protein
VSAQALTAGAPAGEAAIAQRVQQLQAMLERTRQAAFPALAAASPSPPAPSAAPGGFAEALQMASAASVSGGGTHGASGSYDAMIGQAAARNGVDPAVLHGLIQQESGFDPNATSSAGAMGLTQLMPGTASSLGVANPLDPAESIEGGARYLSQMQREFAGNTEAALAAYNAGPGAVRQYGGVPPYAETQSYVSKVLAYAETYRQSHAATVGAPA